jgi:UDP-3-O-[3-hydroxymyristoyl] N-acetylglucosamine deacetylase/3-hydroxyacyl-[acyl-carrier-protein] dehydratase
VNHGTVIVRTDVTEGGEPVRIPALVRHVAKRARRTSLHRGPATIDTCEHLLSALMGLGVDNVEIEINAGEMPAADGSAAPFVDLLKDVGLRPQDQPRKVLTIEEAVTVEDDEAMVAALPSDRPGMEVIYDLDYGEDTAIGRQLFAFNLGEGDYPRQIAPARTFITEQEARALQARGIGKHLSPKDVLVIGDDGPLGGNELRFSDELVRHKILDLVGDLALVGCPIQGRIVAYKSGHALNHQLARQLSKMMATAERRELVHRDGMIDIRQIHQILPHRYPMLLIDRVLEVDGDRRAVGVKNVTINEPFFSGHYPGTPVMPGVLIVEAMAQLSGLLVSQKLEHTGKVAMLLSMDKVKLRRPVTPGDQLVIEAETVRVKSRTGHTRCRAFVGPHLAAEAQIKFMLVDAEPE